MKGIIKKIALILAGIAAISAVSFGVVKLVEFVGQDLKTINLSFEVGNLGTDGKYVNDETTLYTKDAFKCDGLQIKLDFDNAINYRIFFYDDLDMFIESTNVLTGAYSGGIHDSYARIVIIPTDDEDEKISWTEKFTYAGQMTVKVNKVQNTEYVDVLNRRLKIVSNISNLRFTYGDLDIVEGKYQFTQGKTTRSVTSMDVLQIKGGSTVFLDYTSELGTVLFVAAEFKLNNGSLSLIQKTDSVGSLVLSKETQYVVFIFGFMSDTVDIPRSIIEELPALISITK